MFDAVIREVSSRFGLGEKSAMLVRILVADITNEDSGGIAGFIDKFKNAGLGEMASSWLGGGAGAQAISPRQVEQVLGGQGGLITALTGTLGINGQTAASALAFLLPPVVGELTPGASIPTAIPGAVSGFIGNAKDALACAALPIAGVAVSRPYVAASAKKWLLWIVVIAAALFVLRDCNGPKREPRTVLGIAKPAAKPVAEVAKATAIPAGAGLVAETIDGLPLLKVYFDTGKADVASGFGEKVKDVVAYLKAHADAKAVISGFNDPTGNAAANAELSKNRAKTVAASLKAAGIAKDRVVLEKPADTTAGAALSNAEARRVEITVRK
jgi:uncharacterized protein YidB (DUF937 family)/outer membrane protein OmpA-like peptidoglycan-associated protein